MLVSISILLFILILFIPNESASSNINIEPHRVLLNTTSSKKLICTKEKNDHHDFEVYLSPNISTNYIQISTNHLNDTTIEITIQSLNYIGRFSLICSSKGDINHLTHSTIIVSKPPGILFRAEPCIVYYDEYIDCILRAPVMVQAINNNLNYTFNFLERRLPSQLQVYRRNPRLIKIDPINKTLTFRWIPQEPGYFPSEFKMIVYATITDFGTTNHTMDMTPIFRISSNFTAQILSSTDLRIDFKNKKVICHGNLTRIDRYHRESIRIFTEFNLTTIYVTNLRPDTSYRLCFSCRRHELFRSISDIECQKYKTSKTINLFSYDYMMISLFSFLFVIIIIFLVTKYKWNRIKEKIFQHRKNKGYNSYQIIELKASIPDSN